MTRLRPCAPVQRLEPGLCKAQGAGKEVWQRRWLCFLFGKALLCRESGSPAVAMRKSNWSGSELLCLPWVCSGAPLCCDGASDMDVVSPFPMCALWLVLGAASMALSPAEPGSSEIHRS